MRSLRHGPGPSGTRSADSLPLIHAHGLVLGLFGSLRVGGTLHYVPRFSAEGIAEALMEPRTTRRCFLRYRPCSTGSLTPPRMMPGSAKRFGVPRLLVSGSAGLSVREHQRIQALTGRGVHQRYGLTETLINCAVPASHAPMPGYVGPPLPGVELKLVDEQRTEIDARDDRTIGEVAIRSEAVSRAISTAPMRPPKSSTATAGSSRVTSQRVPRRERFAS